MAFRSIYNLSQGGLYMAEQEKHLPQIIWDANASQVSKHPRRSSRPALPL